MALVKDELCEWGRRVDEAVRDLGNDEACSVLLGVVAERVVTASDELRDELVVLFCQALIKCAADQQHVRRRLTS